MNIEELTIKQIKEIQSLNFISTKSSNNPMIGKYCIARCYSAGVHAGYVKEVINDTNVVLTDSRRLYTWKGTGIALSGVANGKLLSGQKVDVLNPEIYLTGVCELIPCTEESRVSICEYK